jgi:hypothetical protein
MPDQFLKSDYTGGSQTTGAEPALSPPVQNTVGGATEAESMQVTGITAGVGPIDTNRYGMGKPKRVVIRGKIAR